MIVHRTRNERSTPHSIAHRALADVVEPRVAVLLNANAKSVDAKLRHLLAQVVPERDLFLTRSLDEAREVAVTVLERRYPMVFTGGGDGSFVGFVNAIQNVLEERRRAHPGVTFKSPQFGILKLGTGNAIAYACGASSQRSHGLVDDILRARAGETPHIQKLDLLMTEGKRAPFAGVGVDAGILNDYVETRRSFEGLGLPLASKALRGGGGYALAIATRSLPAYLLNGRPNIEVTSKGMAFRVDKNGMPVGPAIAPGEVLYRGPALMAAASTIPCYGYNLKLFPFAGMRRGMMQLRIANLSVRKVIPNLYPGLWQGKYFGEGMHDFLAEDVELKLDRKVPFQIAGDAEGYRDQVRFAVTQPPIEMLDFRSQNARA